MLLAGKYCSPYPLSKKARFCTAPLSRYGAFFYAWVNRTAQGDFFCCAFKKSGGLYRSVVAVQCFFMRGKLFNQKRKSTTTEEQKCGEFCQITGCDEAERGARGSGGASSPGCGKRGAIPVPLSPEKAEEGAELRHITTKQATNTPTRPPKQTRGSGRRGVQGGGVSTPCKKSPKAKRANGRRERAIPRPSGVRKEDGVEMCIGVCKRVITVVY